MVVFVVMVMVVLVMVVVAALWKMHGTA